LTEPTRYEPLPGVHVFVGGPLKVNMTALVDGDEALVVDSTASIHRAARAYRYLTGELGLRVVAVVNTHWHSDHCGGNAGLTGDGAPVIAHRRHFETISLERNMVSRRPARIAFERLVRPRVVMDRRLELRLGRRTVHLLHAPGHSPDLVMVWDPSRGTLIASDNLLAGDDPEEPAVPYFYWGDPWRLEGALELVRSLSPGLIVPGHGAPVPAEHAERAVGHALDYLRRLLARLDELPRDVPLEVEDEPPPAWLEAVSLSDCLPIRNPPDWVGRMHELNLLRLYLGVRYANP
jgi:glyoxylase-like metal-dependent hydrolase (beta-lactamase superfamily II)